MAKRKKKYGFYRGNIENLSQIRLFSYLFYETFTYIKN